MALVNGSDLPAVSIPRNAPEFVKRMYRWYEASGPTIIMVAIGLQIAGRTLDGIGTVLVEVSRILTGVKVADAAERIAGAAERAAAPPDPADVSEVRPGAAPRSGGYAGAGR